MDPKYEVLLWIAAAGAFGGFVDGLLSEKVYSFRLGKKMKNLGSIGDCLIGATAGIAIFSVAGSLLKVDFTKMASPDEFVRVIALGVLSGFAGIRLLQPMTEKLVQRLASEEAQKKVKNLTTGRAENSLDINLANGCLTNYEMGKKLGEAMMSRKDLEGFLANAEKAADRVLERDPTNEEALRAKAKVYKRRAELTEDSGDKIRFYNAAIALTNRMVANNPQSDIGYYNRACYKSLLRTVERSRPPDDILEDLDDAIRLSEPNKQRAMGDPDFDSIKNLERFRELTGQKSRAATAAG